MEQIVIFCLSIIRKQGALNAYTKALTGDAVVNVIHDHLQAVAASDEAFEEKLRGSIYDENPEATRFILCSIEAQHQTKEIYSDLWARDTFKRAEYGSETAERCGFGQ